jgi:2-polyprenyl-6-methoxyphenol hydroxylase-like FAD-dependent oxidoreductase
MTNLVAVAGGGPAGMLLAAELRLAGVPVVVLERRPEPAEGSGGMLLHSRSLTALRLRGVADRFLAGDPPVWPRTHFAFLWLNLTELASTDYDLVIPQWRTERLLEQRATELGADIRRGHRVVAVDQDVSGVTVGVRSDTDEYPLRCAYLVGCDGPHSTVAELAGFEFDERARSYYGVIADVPVPGSGAGHFQAGVFPNGQFGVLPVNPADPGELRLMTVEFDREPPGADVAVTVAELAESIRRITGTDQHVPTPRWLTRYGSPTRLAAGYRSGRVLLAGDAAHPHPPSAGNGLNTALHDALNLGWKLAGAAHGWAPPGLLDTYHDERHPVGHRACLRALAQIPLQHPPAQAAPLRELFTELIRFEEVNRYLVRLVTEVRYPIGEPAGQPDHPLLGAMLPESVLDTPAAEPLVAGRGVVLDQSGCDLPDLTPWRDRVELVRARVPGLEAPTILVRPDGHVAWVSADGDSSGLVVAVKTWFG